MLLFLVLISTSFAYVARCGDCSASPGDDKRAKNAASVIAIVTVKAYREREDVPKDTTFDVPPRHGLGPYGKNLVFKKSRNEFEIDYEKDTNTQCGTGVDTVIQIARMKSSAQDQGSDAFCRDLLQHGVFRVSGRCVNNKFFLDPCGIFEKLTFRTIHNSLLLETGVRDVTKRNTGFQSLERDLKTLRDLTVLQTSDLATVKDLIDTIVSKEDSAKSKSTWKATRAKRDAALALLIKRLKMKKAEHAHAESLDVKDTIPTKTIASGAKLGFEYEIATALVDVNKCGTKALKYFLTSDPVPNFLTDSTTFGGGCALEKMKVGFSFKNGIVKGTADSTVPAISNLEFVSEPLTATEWDSQQAKEDLESLRSFLTKTTNNVLENPKWLEPTIKNEIAGIRIFKDPLLPCQVNFQFTRAVCMKKNTKDVPSTWPAGMNWHALPYLCDVFRWSLIDPNTAPKMESNPKNYFRVGDEKFNSLIKSPMKSVLGQPSSKLSTKQISDFVALVKGECNIPDVDVKFAKSMTDFYTSTNQPQAAIRAATFSYKDYLEDLVTTTGKDKISVWGKTAFEAADEQIGIGQLEDSTLPANMIIIEDRSGASSGPHAVPGIVADWKLKNPSPCFT